MPVLRVACSALSTQSQYFGQHAFCDYCEELKSEQVITNDPLSVLLPVCFRLDRSELCNSGRGVWAGGGGGGEVNRFDQKSLEHQFMISLNYRLLGLMVRRPPRERTIPGSNPACDGIFSGSSHTSELKIGTPVGYPARRLAL